MAGARRRSPFEFTSSSFDPRQALQSESVNLPYPEARIYNNLAEYSSHTFGRRGTGRPAGGGGGAGGGGSRDRYDRDRGGSGRYRSPSPRYRASSPRHRYRSPSPPSRRYRSPSPGIPRAYRSPSPRRSSSSRYRSPSPGPSYSRRRSPPGRRDRDRSRDKYGGGKPFRGGGRGGGRDFPEKKKFLRTDPQDVLERMEKAFAKGPLEILYRCVQEKTRVKVWTRNYKEVRGICTGYIQAFDKHWNMAMSDVDEVYLKPRKGKTPFLRELKPGDEELIPDMLPRVPKGAAAKTQGEETAQKGPTEVGGGDTPERPKPSEQTPMKSGAEGDESWYSAAGDVDMDVSETPERKITQPSTTPATEGDDGYQSEQAFPGNGEQDKTTEAKEGDNMDTTQDDDAKEADKNKLAITFTKLPLTGEDIEELTKGKKKKKKKKRKGKGHEMCKRHVNKLFIRGDNVVMVALLKV